MHLKVGRLQIETKLERRVFVIGNGAARGLESQLQDTLSRFGLDIQAFHSADELVCGAPSNEVAAVIVDATDIAEPLPIIRRLVSRGILFPIIVVAGNANVDTVVSIIKAGAMDFLKAPVHEADLAESIRRALDMDSSRLRERVERIELRRRASQLTVRERQVMELVVTGYANKQSAAELGCSSKTVEVHRSRVMEKMCAANLPDLVKMSMRLNQEMGHCGGRRPWRSEGFEPARDRHVPAAGRF